MIPMSFVQNTKHNEHAHRYANTGNTPSEARREKHAEKWVDQKEAEEEAEQIGAKGRHSGNSKGSEAAKSTQL